jgi:hypothetical protein
MGAPLDFGRGFTVRELPTLAAAIPEDERCRAGNGALRPWTGELNFRILEVWVVSFHSLHTPCEGGPVEGMRAGTGGLR